MTIYKCKSFIRAGSSSASIDRLPIAQSPFTYSENTVIPHIWPSLYLYLYFPGRFGLLNSIGRPPFACNAFSTQSRNMGASEFVGFDNLWATLLSGDSNPQNHTTDTELSRQNRLRDVNINRDKNRDKSYKFSFIPGWVRWIFGSMMTLWSGHMISDLLKIEGEVEEAVEILEDIAETVEKLATMTEKICHDIEVEFPAEGAINKAAHFVEHLSEEVVEDAQNTQEFIHKITSTEKIVETSIETAVEALEDLINVKPAIFKLKSNDDDKVIYTSTENLNHSLASGLT